jgi:hypothetical protein
MPAADRRKRNSKAIQANTLSLTMNNSAAKGSWATSKILTASSAITAPSTDIYAFLITCMSGFDSYSEAEKHAIIDVLPEPYRKYNLTAENKLECPLSLDFVMSDPFLKRAISKFKNDVSEGYYDPTWQSKARVAMQERRDGVFDEYLKRHVEKMFGDGVSSDPDNGSAALSQDISSLDQAGPDRAQTAVQPPVSYHSHVPGQNSFFERDDDDLAAGISSSPSLSDGEYLDDKSRKRRRAVLA